MRLDEYTAKRAESVTVDPVSFVAQIHVVDGKTERGFDGESAAAALAAALGGDWRQIAPLDFCKWRFEIRSESLAASILFLPETYGARAYERSEIVGYVTAAEPNKTRRVAACNVALHRGADAWARDVARKIIPTLQEKSAAESQRAAENAALRGRLERVTARLSRKYGDGIKFRLDGEGASIAIRVETKYGGNVTFRGGLIRETAGRRYELTSDTMALRIADIDTPSGRAILKGMTS